jgi:hypothetical protein
VLCITGSISFHKKKLGKKAVKTNESASSGDAFVCPQELHKFLKLVWLQSPSNIFMYVCDYFSLNKCSSVESVTFTSNSLSETFLVQYCRAGHIARMGEKRNAYRVKKCKVTPVRSRGGP